ncbi:MAG TPA: hypothetical protein PLO34_00175, partial [Pseudoxanthomonas sp.]|nr:hypothetical protein [Pseudoxanthomonas sp.]
QRRIDLGDLSLLHVREAIVRVGYQGSDLLDWGQGIRRHIGVVRTDRRVQGAHAGHPSSIRGRDNIQAKGDHHPGLAGTILTPLGRIRRTGYRRKAQNVRDRIDACRIAFVG